MTQTLDAGLPPGIDLDGNYLIRFTAINTSTGAVDAGVVISAASLLVESRRGGNLEDGFADVEPLFTPVPANLFQPEGS